VDAVGQKLSGCLGKISCIHQVRYPVELFDFAFEKMGLF
jgi:hypothetical protein